MTIIAWDGKELAGDKLTNFCGLSGTTIKVHKIKDKLVGGCGTSAQIQEMLKWIELDCLPEKFPLRQRNTDDYAIILCVNKDGSIHQYETTPYPIVLQNKFWAIGVGRDFAMAAMYLGKTAREAVEIASVFCPECGNGFDVVMFTES